MGLRVNPTTLLTKSGNSPLIVSEERSRFAGESSFHLTHTQTHTTTSRVLCFLEKNESWMHNDSVRGATVHICKAPLK